jgi:cell division septation protein DedD
MRRLIILILSLILAACSSSSETTTDSDDSGAQEVYIFDDVTEDVEDTGEVPEIETPVEAPPVKETVEEPAPAEEKTIDFYIVQVGAFTTKDRAQTFIDQNKDKIEYEMNIHFSESVKLYVVQLQPFRTRGKAEEVRNALWNTGRFNDAFIVPK